MTERVIGFFIGLIHRVHGKHCLGFSEAVLPVFAKQYFPFNFAKGEVVLHVLALGKGKCCFTFLSS
jgi:hypothetical protein